MNQKLYGRQKEIKSLKETVSLSQKVGSQFTLIFGRRRVGKSALVHEAFKNKKTLFFFISKRKSGILLKELTHKFNQETGLNAAYTDWDYFFFDLFKYSAKNKITVIFDEFQNFNFVDEDIFGLIQKHWEDYENMKGLNLVITGSTVSLVEQIFYDSREPLYGRVTRSIKLESLRFKTIYELLSENKTKSQVNIKTLLEFYTVFGGIPYYYRTIGRYDLYKKSIYQIIERTLVENDGVLREEGRDLIVREFGTENVYNLFGALEAISQGMDQFGQICSYIESNESVTNTTLNTLQNRYRLVTKLKPVFPNNRKDTKYKIHDNFMNFYFKSIYSNQQLIQEGVYEALMKKIKSTLPEQLGFTFEDLAKEFILSNLSELDILPTSIGKWWDRTTEIDLIIDDKVKNKTFFVECKLNTSKYDIREIFHNLAIKADKVDALKGRSKYFILVSGGAVKNKKTLSEKERIFDYKDITLYLNGKG